jgi:DNA modification methylase
MMDTIFQGDAWQLARTLPDASVQCIVTSPPYWGLRSYLPDGHADKGDEFGCEPTPAAYVGKLVALFAELRRALRDDGTIWIVIGDSYFSGSQRAGAYGTPDKEPEGCQDRDCSSGNPCDACRDQERHIIRTGRRNDPKPTALPSAPNPAYTASERDHLPTSDSARREDRNAIATQHLGQDEARVDEQPRASLESRHLESSRRHPEDYHPSDSSSAFPSGVYLDSRDAVPSADTTADPSLARSMRRDALDSIEAQNNTPGIAETGGSSAYHTSDTAYDLAYPDYTKPSRHSLKPKDMVGIPWRVAFALQADGWYLRSDCIWHKPNPMPSSVRDRPTTSHEYVFLLSKSARYYYDADAVREPHAPDTLAKNGIGADGKGYTVHRTIKPEEYLRPYHSGNMVPGSPRSMNLSGRNRRSVWTIATQPYAGAHFATFPPALVEPCVKAGCPVGGVVLDPFSGSGTVAAVAAGLGRRYIGFELNPAYIDLANARLRGVNMPLLAEAL